MATKSNSVVQKLLTCGTFAAIVFASAVSLAQTPPIFSREALFERAFQSTAFLMTIARLDPSFNKSLSADEAAAYEQVYLVAQMARNRQWLMTQNLEKIPHQGKDYFYYVAADNKVLRVGIDVQFGLKFSDDRKLFVLDRNGSERSAMTSGESNFDIYVNRPLINSPEFHFSFTDAVALIIHEFGHKLGPHENESIIYSLSTKLKKFLDSQTVTVGEPKNQISVLRFKRAPFDPWFEGTLMGFIPELNHPRQFEYLKVFDGEGTYIFAENKFGIHDLTQTIFSDLSQRQVVKFEKINPYNWMKFNWFLTSGLEIKPNSHGNYSVRLNLNQLQVVLPFLHRGVPDPGQFNLYQKAFPTAPPSRGVFESFTWNLDMSKPKPIIASSFRDRLEFENPTIKVDLVETKWQNDTLIIRMRIPDGRRVPMGSDMEFKTWPFLQFEFAGKLFDIRATDRSNNDHYEFRLPDVRTQNSGSLKLVGAYLAAEKQNLALDNQDTKIKLFLTEQKEFSLVGSARQTQTRLLRTEIGDGSQWRELGESSASRLAGTHIRFVFESTNKLVALSYLQNYMWVSEYTFSMAGLTMPSAQQSPIRNQEPRSQWVSVGPEEMKQTLTGNALYVELEIDKNLHTKHTMGNPIMVDHRGGAPLPSSVTNPMDSLSERYNLQVLPERAIETIKFTNQSLHSSIIDYQIPLKLKKFSASPALKGPYSNRPVISCRKIF